MIFHFAMRVIFLSDDCFDAEGGTCPSPGTPQTGLHTPPAGSPAPTAEAHGTPCSPALWTEFSSAARPSLCCQRDTPAIKTQSQFGNCSVKPKTTRHNKEFYGPDWSAGQRRSLTFPFPLNVSLKQKVNVMETAALQHH